VPPRRIRLSLCPLPPPPRPPHRTTLWSALARTARTLRPRRAVSPRPTCPSQPQRRPPPPLRPQTTRARPPKIKTKTPPLTRPTTTIIKQLAVMSRLNSLTIITLPGSSSSAIRDLSSIIRTLATASRSIWRIETAIQISNRRQTTTVALLQQTPRPSRPESLTNT
jgi:hypothetical protein